MYRLQWFGTTILTISGCLWRRRFGVEEHLRLNQTEEEIYGATDLTAVPY